MTVGFRSLKALYFVLHNLGIMNFFWYFFYSYFYRFQFDWNNLIHFIKHSWLNLAKILFRNFVCEIIGDEKQAVSWVTGVGQGDSAKKNQHFYE